MTRPNASEWQPIASAPRDGTRFLAYGGRFRRVSVARWEVDRFAQKPRPYFMYESVGRQSVTDDRSSQPTHWMPLPAPPEQGQ